MASLDSLKGRYDQSTRHRPWTEGLRSDIEERSRQIQYGLASPLGWDIPNRTPLNRLQPVDPAVRDNGYPNPPVDQAVYPSNFYVPLSQEHPASARRRIGATVGGIDLFDGPRMVTAGQRSTYPTRVANVRTWSRFAPYRTQATPFRPPTTGTVGSIVSRIFGS